MCSLPPHRIQHTVQGRDVHPLPVYLQNCSIPHTETLSVLETNTYVLFPEPLLTATLLPVSLTLLHVFKSFTIPIKGGENRSQSPSLQAWPAH